MNQSRVFGRFGFIDGQNQLLSLRVDAQRELLIPCLFTFDLSIPVVQEFER